MPDHDARRGAGEAERDRAVRDRRLLRHAGGEVGVVAPQPLGRRARDLLDLGLELRVDVQADAERLRDHLDRAVVVRRAEPAGDEADVGLEPLAQRRLELLGRVADDRDPRRLEAEPERLAREERAVQVGALAAHELAARDDDEGARPAQVAARAVRVGVTSTFRLRPAGSETALPPSDTRTPEERRT